MSGYRTRGIQARIVVIAAALAAASLPATAQEADAEDAELERVEVTGTRIRQSDLEGANPIQVVSRDELDRSGLRSIGDFLQQLAISGSTINTKFNSSGNFGFPPDGTGVGAGATYADIHHLGPKRVLVLVDGIRWVNDSSGSGVGAATDLNTIPMSIVERIEILKDGASAIYGSDAIAGVINIITRRDADGLTADAYYGEYDEGDGEMMSAEVSYGLTRERASVFFSLSHTDQQEVSASDREQSFYPVPGTGVTRGSSGTPQGRFIFFHPDTAGGLCPLVDTNDDDLADSPLCDLTTPQGSSFGGDVPAFPGDFIPFSNDERFNFAPYNLVVTPSRRSALFSQAHFDIAPRVQLYLRGLYNNRSSVNRAAPEPIFLGSDAGTGGLGDVTSIDATNPYNPLGYTLEAGVNFLLLGRRPIEGGPRIFEQDVDTFYVGAGARGDFDLGGNVYYWDINAADSNSRADQTTYGSYNSRRIMNALGPVAACDADPLCVPLNLFGGLGTITQEMLDYIQPVLHDISENSLRLYSANVTGDLFDMPAGPFAFAAGFETRELSGFYQPDALVVAGESNGVPSTPTSGSYDVDEYYIEAKVPLLASVTAAEQLDLTLASRWFDYSTFGSDSTTKFGIEWRPTGELLVRASAAEGFRAPGIGELFGNQARFDAQLNDPCSGNVTANCEALGVPAGYTQINPQISITTGGNPDLLPEESDSLMYGLVYSPGWATGLDWSDRIDFELTFYDHEITNSIQAIDAQFQLDACVASGDSGSVYCQGITRTASGQINSFANQLTNIGGVETSGFDFNVRYSSPALSWGRLTVDWFNSFVNDYEEILPTGDRVSLAGVERADRAIPEFQSNVFTNIYVANWTFNWTMRYIDAVMEDCADFVEEGLCSHPASGENELDATLYNDVYVSYLFDAANLSVSFGIDNLLDEDPPICLSCSLNGYDASTHDIPGRFYYLRASWRM